MDSKHTQQHKLNLQIEIIRAGQNGASSCMRTMDTVVNFQEEEEEKKTSQKFTLLFSIITTKKSFRNFVLYQFD